MATTGFMTGVVEDALDASSRVKNHVAATPIAMASNTATTAMIHFTPPRRGGGADGPVPGGK
jgi:hypothetical protein